MHERCRGSWTYCKVAITVNETVLASSQMHAGILRFAWCILLAWGASKLKTMLRQALITVLLAGVALLGSDAQALACELSCAAEAHPAQRDSDHRHAHHHSDAVSGSMDLQPHAMHSMGNEQLAPDQASLAPPPGCAAADHVALNVQVAKQAPAPSYHVLVDSHVSAGWLMAHHSPSEFDSPPSLSSASHHSSTPLRI